jgi:hypothetical protein
MAVNYYECILKMAFEQTSVLVYPVESPTIYGGDEDKNFHSLLRVGFKTPPFLTGFTPSVIFPTL